MKIEARLSGKRKSTSWNGRADMVKIDDIVEQISVNPFTMYSEYRL